MPTVVKTFLNPEKLLFQAGVAKGQTVADMGSGSGHFALAAARIVGPNGQVFAVDVFEPSLNHIQAAAAVLRINNLKTFQCDLETAGCKSIKEGSVDVVILANVLSQIKERQTIFREIYRVLRTSGKLLVVEWSDKASSFGPEPESRISMAVVTKLLPVSGFQLEQELPADFYHYCLLFRRT